MTVEELSKVYGSNREWVDAVQAFNMIQENGKGYITVYDNVSGFPIGDLGQVIEDMTEESLERFREYLHVLGLEMDTDLTNEYGIICIPNGVGYGGEE